jgi:hypothetical protein
MEEAVAEVEVMEGAKVAEAVEEVEEAEVAEVEEADEEMTANGSTKVVEKGTTSRIGTAPQPNMLN